MKFRHVTLSVKDMDASLRFYQNMTGLELHRRYQARPGTEIAFLGSGETEVELISSESDASAGPAPGQGISLGFESASLEDTIRSLRENNYETDGVIQSPNPNVRFFFALDPDGYRIQFITPEQVR